MRVRSDTGAEDTGGGDDGLGRAMAVFITKREKAESEPYTVHELPYTQVFGFPLE